MLSLTVALVLALAKAGELALSLLHVSGNLLLPLWLKAFASVLEAKSVRVDLSFRSRTLLGFEPFSAFWCMISSCHLDAITEMNNGELSCRSVHR